MDRIYNRVTRDHLIIISTMTQIFVGGLNKTSGVAEVTSYFKSFGTISEVKIVADRKTGLSRGFGFVTFEDASSANDVLTRQEKAKLQVDGASVDCKPMSTNNGDEESKSAKKKKKATKKRKADDGDEDGPGEYATNNNNNATSTPSTTTTTTPSVTATPKAPVAVASQQKKAKVAIAPVAPPKPAPPPGNIYAMLLLLVSVCHIPPSNMCYMPNV
jgi:RNA recognition motif-containing protein